MKELTSRQQDVFNWVCKFKSEMNYCPTVTETGKAFGITEQGMQSTKRHR